jgi:hypothetical protein
MRLDSGFRIENANDEGKILGIVSFQNYRNIIRKMEHIGINQI